MAPLIVFFGKYLIYIIVAIFVGYFFSARKRVKRKMLLLSILSFPAVYGVGTVAGYFFYNARPFVVGNFKPLIDHAANNGFPSDHTLLSVALATTVLIYNRALGLLLLVCALCVGVARVLAGVHHTVDIVAGAAVAFLGILSIEKLIHFARWYRG